MADRISYRFLCFLLLSAFLFAIGNVWAAQEQYSEGKDYSKAVVPVEKSWCEAPPPWEIRIGLPGWLAGLDGDSGVKGVEAESDVTFGQLFKHLTHIPIALSINARYGRWEFWVDGQYIPAGGL